METWHVDPTFTGIFCGDPLCSCTQRAHEQGVISRRTLMEQLGFVENDPAYIEFGIRLAEHHANGG